MSSHFSCLPLELTLFLLQYGTENDADFKYANGNEEPGRGEYTPSSPRPSQLTANLAGFGHIAISVDDVEAECKRLDGLGVQFKKRPEEGRMKHIAFVVRLLAPRGGFLC